MNDTLQRPDCLALAKRDETWLCDLQGTFHIGDNFRNQCSSGSDSCGTHSPSRALVNGELDQFVESLHTIYALAVCQMAHQCMSWALFKLLHCVGRRQMNLSVLMPLILLRLQATVHCLRWDFSSSRCALLILMHPIFVLSQHLEELSAWLRCNGSCSSACCSKKIRCLPEQCTKLQSDTCTLNILDFQISAENSICNLNDLKRALQYTKLPRSLCCAAFMAICCHAGQRIDAGLQHL